MRCPPPPLPKLKLRLGFPLCETPVLVTELTRAATDCRLRVVRRARHPAAAATDGARHGVARGVAEGAAAPGRSASQLAGQPAQEESALPLPPPPPLSRGSLRDSNPLALVCAPINTWAASVGGARRCAGRVAKYLGDCALMTGSPLVSHSGACIGSPCLRHCVHGAAIGDRRRPRARGLGAAAAPGRAAGARAHRSAAAGRAARRSGIAPTPNCSCSKPEQ